MMNFLKTIQDSIYSPKFYKTIAQKSFKQSIGYFLLLALLLTIVRLVTLINPLFVEAPKAIQGFANQIINCFPKDLEIKVTNGQAAINTKEPYFISSCDGKNQKLVVIDTKTPYSVEKFAEYKANAWLTKDALVYKNSSVEMRTYKLTNVKNFKLNKEVLNSYLNMATPYLKFVGPVLSILTFIGLYLSYDFRLIHLLIIATLILVLGKIFKQETSFGTSYKLGLYAITLGLIVDIIVGLTGRWTGIYGFPFLVTIITLVVVPVNLFLPNQDKS